MSPSEEGNVGIELRWSDHERWRPEKSGANFLKTRRPLMEKSTIHTVSNESALLYSTESSLLVWQFRIISFFFYSPFLKNWIKIIKLPFLQNKTFYSS